jgi:hypothetical protein
MRVSVRLLAALALSGALLLGGCAGDDGENTVGGSGSGGDGGSSPADDVLAIEVEIEDGHTTPSGARVDAVVGETIRLEVDSDMADELHLHSNPEQSFDVEAADDQVFEFSLDTSGVYELESHGTGNQIVSIQVQP